MSDATITVRGQATMAAEPDEVDLTLGLRALERSADRALADVARRSERLHEILERLGVAADRRQTSGVSVQEERVWEKQRYVSKGFRAVAQLRVRLEDPEPLGRLMTEAVDLTDAEIGGPFWRVRDDNPAHAEACTAAAVEARRKADAYATALGGRLGPVLMVAEDDTGPTNRTVAFALSAPAQAGGGAGAPHVDLMPGTIEVDASVEITFAFDAG